MAKTALVVDDDPDVGSCVQRIMEIEGYQVLRAYDGVEAVALATSEIPSVIIMDVMMPKMDGIEALQALKANSATQNIPVILLTAKGEDSDVANGWRNGAALYLKKPFVSIQLVAFVELLLQ